MRRLCPMPGQSRDADAKTWPRDVIHRPAHNRRAKKRCTLELNPAARILPLSCYGSSASLIYRNAGSLSGGK